MRSANACVSDFVWLWSSRVERSCLVADEAGADQLHLIHIHIRLAFAFTQGDQ